MKINPKYSKRVNEAAANYRKVLVEQTIELLKLIGARIGQDVMLKRTLILFENNGKTTETKLVNTVSYMEHEGSDSYLILTMGERHLASSLYLSLSNLQLVYNEVHKVVSAE